MALRRIIEARRVGPSTFITLEHCGHKRSFGGHVYNGREQQPHELKGQHYECAEGHCYNSKNKPVST